jgi:hypothetical protein
MAQERLAGERRKLLRRSLRSTNAATGRNYKGGNIDGPHRPA